MSGHLDGPPPGPPDPPYIPGDLGAPSAKEFARRRAGDRHMNDNPYPNASDTMHYELHTAWDEGYAEGFAAGRAAATPDPPPDDLCAVVFRALHSSRNTQMSDEMRAAYIASVITAEAAPAASPDERLREAGERLAQTVAQVCGEGHPALGMWRVALAAADREAPDGETPAASPDERLREALTAAHDALRAYAISAPCPGIEVDWAEGEVSGCRDDPAPRDCPTCAAVAAALAGVSAEAAPGQTTPTFCATPDCGLRATRVLPDADGVRWRPYCNDCAPNEPKEKP